MPHHRRAALSNPETRRARNWRGIALVTLAGTAACLALSFVLNYLLLFSDRLTPFGHSIVSATALPLLIGVPLFLFIGLKLEEVRRYRHQLTRSASYDLLTDCLNGAAFTATVERRTAPPQPAGRRHGAFLVVELAGMRQITTRFGLAWGDEALKLVADTIRASVRAGDVVGRIGADRFGVFLPGASQENALEVGERIRAGVSDVCFAPGGEADLLHVSVGGVVFERELGFEDMFRAADRLLLEAGPAERLRLSVIDRQERPAAH